MQLLETHATAPTQFANAAGIRMAYRRLGAEGAVPLVLLQHFRGNMDNWDPAVVDGLDNAPDALRRLFTGDHDGKVLVKVADA